jgi:hypothetical protein
VQIHSSDFFDYIEKPVSFFQLFNLIGKIELLDNFTCARREPSHEFHEVRSQLVGIAQQILEREIAGVVKAQAELFVDDFLDGISVIPGDSLSGFVELRF